MKIADLVKKEIEDDPSQTELPSLAEVTHKHKVSRGVALRAFGVLRQEGLAEPVPGGRWRVVRAGAWADRHPLDERIADIITAEGLKGGEAFPSASALADRLPQQTVVVMRAHKRREQAACVAAGKEWTDERLVFPTETGELRSALNVRRNFRTLLKEAGFANPKEWTPRELRTSFVSVLSDHGIPIEVILRLVGHNGSGTTERAYRKQLRARSSPREQRPWTTSLGTMTTRSRVTAQTAPDFAAVAPRLAPQS
ncbi:tyrosine-type recombinase/integrase [Streptomyces puniciscabiei]|uniref:tyrosine-type recombinase/integrase n=1 Tax=Streptomyces puniciscabiei TaxID=164348 RepID=UPI003332E5B6